MSKQFFINSICITLFGTFVGYSVTHVIMSRGQPQSIDMASLAPAQNSHRLTKLASQQIYQDYFDIRIKHDLISNTHDGQSILKAIVIAKKDLPAGLNFNWKLGEKVTANSSELAGHLGAIKRGEKQEISISVIGFNKESKKYISFIVSGKFDQHDLYKESLSSSRPEDSFEYVVQQAYKLEQERAQEDSKKNNGKIKTQSVRSKKFDPANIIK